MHRNWPGVVHSPGGATRMSLELWLGRARAIERSESRSTGEAFMAGKDKMQSWVLGDRS